MVIYFDECRYYKAVDILNKLIATINQFNGLITKEDLDNIKTG